MTDEVKTPLDYFKHAYSKLLPMFIGEVMGAGGDFTALSAAAAHLCSIALDLRNASHSIAVVLIDSTGFSNRLNTQYFSSNTVSEENYKPAVRSITKYLIENPSYTVLSPEYLEIIGDQTDTEKAPEKILVIPIRTTSATCGYTIVFFHDKADDFTVDSPQVVFLSKVMYLVALAVQCELNEAMLEHYLMSDNLTDLPNRDHLYEAIIYLLQTAEAFKHRFAIIIIRVNGLKNINNSLGIITGDLMLKAMGELIVSAANESTDCETLVGRFSGGDFILLITLPQEHKGIGDDGSVIAACCNAIIAKTNEHVDINNYKLYPSVNIGASIYPLHGETAEELIRKADLAKNDSKLMGPGTFSTYQGFMDGDAGEILFLANNLPTAIATNQFEMFYQPMVDVMSGEVVTAEALLRWRHPERGLIFPDAFMPFVEKNAHGIQIDMLVLDMACKQIIDWKKKDIDIIVSVNISPRHFANGLIYNSVQKVLKEFDLDPSCLRLELLENVILDDFNAAIKVINDLRSLGVEIALDDFGSGYSSLEYVSRLPLDYLKIDRIFLMDMQKNPDNKIIMETIMTLAKGMKVKTIAEGVERREDFDFLRRIRCNVAQGYYMSKPVDVSSFEDFLSKWKFS